MEIEQQVCSFELARQLKELGVKQNAYFSWYKNSDFDNQYILNITDKTDIEHYSAFTVAELGEILPQYIFVNENTPIYFLSNNKKCGYYFTKRYIYENFVIPEAIQTLFQVNEDIEANSRAQMLCYILRGKFVKIEDINKKY